MRGMRSLLCSFLTDKEPHKFAPRWTSFHPRRFSSHLGLLRLQGLVLRVSGLGVSRELLDRGVEACDFGVLLADLCLDLAVALGRLLGGLLRGLFDLLLFLLDCFDFLAFLEQRGIDFLVGRLDLLLRALRLGLGRVDLFLCLGLGGFDAASDERSESTFLVA